jgi:hypothetical protein
MFSRRRTGNGLLLSKKSNGPNPKISQYKSCYRHIYQYHMIGIIVFIGVFHNCFCIKNLYLRLCEFQSQFTPFSSHATSQTSQVSHQESLLGSPLAIPVPSSTAQQALLGLAHISAIQKSEQIPLYRLSSCYMS